MRYVIIVLALALLAFLVMDFNARTAELNRLAAEKEIVEAKVEAREQTKEALENQIAYATSEAAAQDWAYEDGHMTRPGDFPVVAIQSAESTPPEREQPTVVATEISNWQRWLSLFVDP